MLKPTGEPQPDQVSAFSAYFHSSASVRWIVLICLLLWTKEIRHRSRCVRLLSWRSVGWYVELAGLKPARSARSVSGLAPAMFAHRRSASCYVVGLSLPPSCWFAH